MNLRQLQTLCEIVDNNLKITEAADSLFRSQSVLTRHIQDLEHELGMQIFRRSRNRILNVTDKGKEVLVIARRILADVDNLSRLSKDLAELGEGDFTIATTHTQAYYFLPRIILAFRQKHPKIRLSFLQGTPPQCYAFVMGREADIALCTKGGESKDLVEIPCYRLNRSIVTPKGHPLLRAKDPGLEKIAKYPLIAYDKAFTSRQVIDNAFLELGLRPTTVLNSIDAELSKKYVELGFGVAIIPTLAYDSKRDVHLRAVNARKLFPGSIVNIVYRREMYLRRYMMDFMTQLGPHISIQELQHANEGVSPKLFRNLPER